MARKKSTETIDAEIAKVMAEMSKLQDRYDKLADMTVGSGTIKFSVDSQVAGTAIERRNPQFAG